MRLPARAPAALYALSLLILSVWAARTPLPFDWDSAACAALALAADERVALEADVKYAGYVEREREQVNDLVLAAMKNAASLSVPLRSPGSGCVRAAG